MGVDTRGTGQFVELSAEQIAQPVPGVQSDQRLPAQLLQGHGAAGLCRAPLSGRGDHHHPAVGQGGDP
ncbi:hypothetical protein D9M71_186660 [compost metagenome]